MKLNGTKLDTRVHQVALGNTWTLSSTLVNEFRFGYNYFFNTFGRELAFERDVIKELNIPGISLNPPEAWGIPSIGITGFSGFGDSTEGPYTNRNHAFEFNDNLSWIRGRHSFKAGGGIRYDMYNQVGNQFARGNFQFQNDRDRLCVRRLPARLRATDRIRGRAGGDEVPRAEPDVLLHRHVEGPLEHDVRSRPALRIHAALARRERHVDERATSRATTRRRTCRIARAIRRWCASAAVTSTRTPCSASRRTFRWLATAALAIGWCSTTRRTSRRGSAGPGTRARSGPIRAGTGIFYMQDTGNPRFDMARNLSGRRRDNTLLLTPDLTLDAPFRGVGSANDCGVAPPLVCLTNVYVLGNMPDRKTPYMWQYLFNVQRELGGSTALEVGYLGSHSYRLERMFDWNETIPGLTGSVQSRKPYPEFTKVQEIGNVAEAKYNSLAVKLTRRLHQWIVGARRLHALQVDGQRQRHPHAQRRHAVPAGQFLPRVRVGLVDLRRAPSVCLVDPVRAAVWRGQALSAERHRRRDARRLAGQHDHLHLEWISEKRATVGTDRSNTGGGQDRPNATGQEVELPRDQRTIAALVQHECVRRADGRHLGERRAEHGARPGYHQRGCVDHPELPASAPTRFSSGSRRSTP